MRRRGKACAEGVTGLLAAVLLQVFVLLATAYLGLFRADFLFEECEKYQVASRLEISREELRQVTEELMLCVTGRGGNMDIAVNRAGEIKPFFNQRDVEHLEDIAELIRLGKGICLGCGIGAAVLILILAWRKRLRLLRKGYLVSWLLLLGTGLAVGIWMLVDLTGFINAFHRLFFQNNLWVLNPAKDMLIWLFPEELFRDAAVVLGLRLAVIHGLFSLTTFCFFPIKFFRKSPINIVRK